MGKGFPPIYTDSCRFLTDPAHITASRPDEPAKLIMTEGLFEALTRPPVPELRYAYGRWHWIDRPIHVVPNGGTGPGEDFRWERVGMPAPV